MPKHGGKPESSKKKKKKKSKMKKHIKKDMHLVVDLQKTFGIGDEPVNPNLRRDDFQGTTGVSDGHVHRFNVQINNGVVRGITDVVDGHHHSIQANTGGQRFISIPTNVGTPAPAFQFQEAQGNEAGGRPTVKREGSVHTHSVTFII